MGSSRTGAYIRMTELDVIVYRYGSPLYINGGPNRPQWAEKNIAVEDRLCRRNRGLTSWSVVSAMIYAAAPADAASPEPYRR